MNEQEHMSQLSALYDSELPAEQAELVIRRVLKDPQMQARWGRYALIGAAIRSEPLSSNMGGSVDVAARVRARLDAETVGNSGIGADGADADRAVSAQGGWARSLFGRGAIAASVAAGVAALSLLMMRITSVDAPVAASMVAATETPVTAPARNDAVAMVASSMVTQRLDLNQDAALPSYTTPVNDGPLVNYAVAHSEVAVSAVRFSPLASVVNGHYDVTSDTVEMTAAEIGARR
jgi:hypothetical protein